MYLLWAWLWRCGLSGLPCLPPLLCSCIALLSFYLPLFQLTHLFVTVTSCLYFMAFQPTFLQLNESCSVFCFQVPRGENRIYPDDSKLPSLVLWQWRWWYLFRRSQYLRRFPLWQQKWLLCSQKRFDFIYTHFSFVFKDRILRSIS